MYVSHALAFKRAKREFGFFGFKLYFCFLPAGIIDYVSEYTFLLFP